MKRVSFAVTGCLLAAAWPAVAHDVSADCHDVLKAFLDCKVDFKAGVLEVNIPRHDCRRVPAEKLAGVFKAGLDGLGKRARAHRVGN